MATRKYTVELRMARSHKLSDFLQNGNTYLTTTFDNLYDAETEASRIASEVAEACVPPKWRRLARSGKKRPRGAVWYVYDRPNPQMPKEKPETYYSIRVRVVGPYSSAQISSEPRDEDMEGDDEWESYTPVLGREMSPLKRSHSDNDTGEIKGAQSFPGHSNYDIEEDGQSKFLTPVVGREMSLPKGSHSDNDAGDIKRSV
jgi:hypothetical protein